MNKCSGALFSNNAQYIRNRRKRSVLYCRLLLELGKSKRLKGFVVNQIVMKQNESKII